MIKVSSLRLTGYFLTYIYLLFCVYMCPITRVCLYVCVHARHRASDREEENAELLSRLAQPACWHTKKTTTKKPHALNRKRAPHFPVLEQLERPQQACQLVSVQRSSHLPACSTTQNFLTCFVWCCSISPLVNFFFRYVQIVCFSFYWLVNWAAFALCYSPVLLICLIVSLCLMVLMLD